VVEQTQAATDKGPAKRTMNVFAVFAIILSVLVAPLGFVFSIIGLVRSGRLRVGRTLSIVALVISLLVTGAGGYAAYRVANVDPACKAADQAYAKYSPQIKRGPTGDKVDVPWSQAVVGLANALYAAIDKAKNPALKEALQNATNDQYELVVTPVTGGDMQAASAKASADRNRISDLCGPF
jgi:hypothetical protein